MRRRQESAFTMSSSNSKIKIARNSFEYQVEKRVPFGKYSILNFQIFTMRGTTVVASAEMSENVLLQILICLQAKRNNFYCKDSLMSLLISGQHIGQSHVAWRPYTKLCKLAWNVSLRTDLRLGYLVYLWVLGNISVSWLLSFNGFKVIFSLRDSETKNYKSFMFKPIWGLCIDTTRIMITVFSRISAQPRISAHLE